MKRLSKALGITAIVLALSGCEGQRPPTVTESSNDNFRVTATTEYSASSGKNLPSAQHIDFSATKKGAYLIEGWRSVYRRNDRLDKIVDFEVTELPFERRIDFSSDVYRAEITYSDGSVMERSTVTFPVCNVSCL
jgi:hypothetical protein